MVAGTHMMRSEHVRNDVDRRYSLRQYISTHLLLVTSTIVVLVLDRLEKIHVENLKDEGKRGRKESSQKLACNGLITK